MQIAALSVMEGLQERGHTIHCVSNAWNDGDFPERLEQGDISYDELSLGKISASLTPKHLWWSFNALIHLPKARIRYRRILDRFAPDLVFFYGFDDPALLAGLHDNVPLAFHVQELPEESRKLHFVLRRHPSALYVAISEYIAERLQALGIARENIRVVHNGVDPATVLNGQVRRADDHEDDSEPVQIGIVGQVGEWKGHEDLIDALSLLQNGEANGQSFQCNVYGTGERGYQRKLKQKAERAGVAESIQWHGFVKDIASIYEGLDVVVVPSRHEEPFGLVAAEAGLWKLPVVVTEQGGLPEVVVDEETGFIVDPESPRQIADRLRRLASDPAQRARMGRDGRARVEEKFTAQAMVEGVENAILDFVR
jgi:glycosyltransferase involved in cell wall biosynthesis